MRCYFLAVAVILTVLPPSRAAESIQLRLQTRVEGYNLSEPTFVGALAAVASQFKIPIGVELVADPSVLRPVKHTWREATAMEILAGLVNGEKGYRLQVTDGIVHIFQTGLVDQRSNFPNIRIGRFHVLDVGAAVAQRTAWEMVKTKFEPLQSLPDGPHGTMGSMFGGGSARTLSLDLRDASVRHILDNIALSSDYPIWVVAFAPGKAPLTPTGFRRTASPRSGSVGELGWEMLRWGEKPY